MKIYKVKLDVNRFQGLLPTDQSVWSKDILTMDGSSKTAVWKPLDVYVHSPNLKVPDFFNLAPGCLAFNQKTCEILRDYLEMSGEILSLTLNKDKLCVLNVLEVVNCLDDNQAKWEIGKRTGAKIRIEKYEFFPERFSESTLFKIPETCRGEILTVEGLKDSEGEFKHAVETNKLKGILFEEIWSNS